MRILVVGAGATGGYFGGRLAQGGRDVTFLVRPARARQLQTTGLVLVSPQGNTTITPQLVTADQITAPFDLVLLAVKAYSLDGVLGDLDRAVGPQTLILPVLNGLKHIDTLAARFGPQAVLGGMCRINSTVDDQGRIIHFDPLHELWYGERDGSTTPRILQIDAALKNPGFDAILTPKAADKMWEKWTLLATIGSVVCLCRGNLGEVARAPGGVEVAQAVHEEVLAVATAAGHRPSNESIQEVRGRLTNQKSEQTTSMYRDLLAGGAVEADQILGDLVARARSFGVPTPLVSTAYVQLSVYQARRS